MKTIVLSPHTYDLLAAASAKDGNRMVHLATRRPDGGWEVSVEDDTYKHLHALALDGETIDDTVSRLARGYVGEQPN